MTEAWQGDFYIAGLAEPIDDVPAPPDQPPLELVRELMPGFVSTQQDREWWYGLPGWRKELYLLPKPENEAERIRQITALGMGVVSYASGRAPITHYSNNR